MSMIVAGVQHDIVWERPDANFAHLAPMIARPRRPAPGSSCCTEMYSTGFSMKTDRIAEPVDGPSAQFLVDQARAARRLGVRLGPRARRRSATCRTTSSCSPAPDGTVAPLRQDPPVPLRPRARALRAGRRFLTVDIEGVRARFFVCYDLRFADEFWALAHETDCYVVPANWPAGAARALDDAAARPRDREPGLRRRREPRRRRRQARVRRRLDDRRSLRRDRAPTPAHDETIIIADIDPDHVRDGPRRSSPSSRTAAKPPNLWCVTRPPIWWSSNARVACGGVRHGAAWSGPRLEAPMQFALFYEIPVATPVGARQRAPRVQEHARAGDRGRAGGLPRVLDGRAPLPRGVLALLEPRGAVRRDREPHRADAPRLRRAAHAEAVQPSRAHRGVGRGARSVERRPGRLRHRPFGDAHRARRLRHRPEGHARHVARGDRARRRLLDERALLVRRASTGRCPTGGCSRSRCSNRTRRSGARRRATTATRRSASSASGCARSRSACRPKRSRRRSTSTATAVAQCTTPIGKFVQQPGRDVHDGVCAPTAGRGVGDRPRIVRVVPEGRRAPDRAGRGVDGGTPAGARQLRLRGRHEGALRRRLTRPAVSLEYLVDSGACVLGTPDQCLEACKRYEAAGVDLLLCLVNPYKIGHEQGHADDRPHRHPRHPHLHLTLCRPRYGPGCPGPLHARDSREFASAPLALSARRARAHGELEVGGDRDGVGVAAAAQHLAGERAGLLAVADDRRAVHDHAVHADRVGEEPAVPPGRSSTSCTSPVATVSGSNITTSAWTPSRSSPRSRRPNSCAGRLRHQLHAPLERDELTAAQRVGEERRGVRRAAHAVEVRAGVGAADHHERVVPRLGAHLPRLQVVVGGQRPQDRAAGRR